jgi:hypothetical protein
VIEGPQPEQPSREERLNAGAIELGVLMADAVGHQPARAFE